MATRTTTTTTATTVRHLCDLRGRDLRNGPHLAELRYVHPDEPEQDPGAGDPAGA